MTPQLIAKNRQKIDLILKTVPKGEDSLWVQSHWARYACVFIYGHIEFSVREIVCCFANTRGSPELSRYVAAQLKWFSNAKTVKILDLIRSLDAGWADELLHFITDERRDAINSIVTNRNRIAHTPADNLTLTITQVKHWYVKADEVIDKIAEICG